MWVFPAGRTSTTKFRVTYFIHAYVPIGNLTATWESEASNAWAINEIPTATPMCSWFSNTIGPMRILCDEKRGKIKAGGHKPKVDIRLSQSACSPDTSKSKLNFLQLSFSSHPEHEIGKWRLVRYGSAWSPIWFSYVRLHRVVLRTV